MNSMTKHTSHLCSAATTFKHVCCLYIYAMYQLVFSHTAAPHWRLYSEVFATYPYTGAVLIHTHVDW